MAGKQHRPVKHSKKSFKAELINNVNKYCNKDFAYKLLTDPKYISYTGWLLLIVEVFVNILIIERVKYTEIDWVAYMQQSEGFLNGTLDYTKLRGDTGPLVYPAGFLYIYTIFYFVTSYGTNIYLAQYIFLVIYILQLHFTFKIYTKTKKVPPYTLILTTLTSYRIHSIYVLRLFNDPIAVLLFYISLNYLLSSKWTLGSIFFSLAVSVKMNILLFAPALLVTFLTNLGIVETCTQIFICGLIQLILGAPFLYGNLTGYIKGSFDLGRVFEHKWTVNYRFLDRSTFENMYFHIALLILHVSLLLLFLPMMKRYLTSYAKLKVIEMDLKPQMKVEKPKSKSKKSKAIVEQQQEDMSKDQQKFLNAFETGLKSRGHKKNDNEIEEEDEDYNINFDVMSQLFVLPFFITNFIGIACARSLHYQFYTWYFHSLLYIVYCTGYQRPVMFLILAVIEYCWNCYPSTMFSSALLHFCHILILLGVYRMMKK